jgi:hypothetical protein
MDAARLEAVKQLYFNSWKRLIADAHESNQYLTAQDADDCVSSLAGKLQHYPLHLKSSEDVFAQWAGNVLAATIFMHGLQRHTEPFARRAIRRVLAQCSDLGLTYRTEFELGTEDEILSNLWLWALTHIDELLREGTAKLTGRIYKRAHFQARAWKSEQLHHKQVHAVIDDLSLLYCEENDDAKTYSIGSVNDWDHDPASLDAMRVTLLNSDDPLAV